MKMSNAMVLFSLIIIIPLLSAGNKSSACWLLESIDGIKNTQINVTSEVNQVKIELSTLQLATKAEFNDIHKKLDSLIQKLDSLPHSRKYVIYNLKKNKAEADTICNASGASLLSVNTEADLAAVKAQIKRERINVEEDCNMGILHSGFWTSGTKTGANEWRWASNGEVIKGSLWQVGEPSSFLPCVNLWHPNDNRFGDNTLKLADEYCATAMCFICQYQ